MPELPTPPLATVSLVAGVVGWAGPVLTPVVAMVTGHEAQGLVAGIGSGLIPLLGMVIAIVAGHLARGKLQSPSAKGRKVAFAGLVLGYLLAVSCGVMGSITLFGGQPE